MFSLTLLNPTHNLKYKPSKLNYNMHSSYFFVFFGVLASLASASDIPDTLYRTDTRNVDEIKKDGGFKAKGFNTPEGTLFQHVEGTLRDPSRDPFVYLSHDITNVTKHGQYLYDIDTAKIHNKIFHVKTEYEKVNRKNSAETEEYAVEKIIPYSAIKGVKAKDKGGRAHGWHGVDMP